MSKNNATRRKLIAGYADAAGCLYGVLSISEFIGIFNHYEQEQTDEEEVVPALQRYLKDNPDTAEYSLYNEYITGPTLHPDEFEDDIDVLEDIRRQQEGKPRYLPAKEEFLKYTDACYYEPEKPYKELKAYILEKGLSEEEGLDGVDGDLIDLHEMIQDRVEIPEIIKYFTERGYIFEGIDQLNAFMQVVMTAHNKTRLYENNGHTPDELMELHKANRPKGNKPIIHIPKKVGRNDPCPCGSGKKYKKCCNLIELSRGAQLTYDECALFYETWYKLLDYVNKKLNVVKYEFSLKYPDPHDETKLHKIRERLWKKPGIIDEFIKNSNMLTQEEVDLLESWSRKHVKRRFMLVRYTPWYSVMMHMEKEEEGKLYAVLGMTSPIAGIMRRQLPIMLETVLLPFKDKIIYDSFINTYDFDVNYGSGAKKMLEKAIAESEEKHGIITSLA